MKKIFSLLTLLSFLSIANAQSGNIFGRVTDQFGEGIPFVNITWGDSIDAKTGTEIKTDADGNYNSPPLLPGKYNLQFSSTGCVSATIKEIIVSADKSTFVNVRLKPQH